MASLHFYITFYYAVNLAVLSETGVNGDDMLDIIKSMKDGAPTNSPSVKSIELSIEPPMIANYAFHYITREIDVLSERPFRDRGTNGYLYSKYFEGAPRDRLDFDGRGIANLTSGPGQYFSLEIAPLNPGTYNFGYDIKERFKTFSRKWTVHSVPSYTMQAGAFFKHELDFSRFQIESNVQTSNLKDIGVRVGVKRGAPEIFGFANNMMNGTILKIKMHLANSSAYTLKVRLLLEDPMGPDARCTREPCLENVKLWIKDFDGTVQNKEKFAECAAMFFGQNITSLIGVKYEDYGIDATFFEAQPLRWYGVAKYIDHIIGTIKNQKKTSKCPYEVIGYDFRFTSSGGARTQWPPAANSVPTTSTEITPGLSNRIHPVGVTSTTESAPESNIIDVGSNNAPEKKKVDANFDRATPTSTERPSKLNAEDVVPAKVSSSTTESVLGETSLGFYPNRAISTTMESTPTWGADDPKPTKVTSTTTERSPVSVPASTTEEAPNRAQLQPVGAPSTTTEEAPESKSINVSSPKGPSTTTSTTTTEIMSRSTATEIPMIQVSKDPAASSPTESSGSTEFASSSNPEASEANRTYDKPVAESTSVWEHIYFQAIVWSIVFVVVFILVVCVSR